jgi:transglutaminase-like putative cysteine protease
MCHMYGRGLTPRVVLAIASLLTIEIASVYAQSSAAGLETGLSADDERVILALPDVPAGLNRRYTLSIKPSKTVSAEYTYAVRAPNLSATEWVIFTAKPPDLACQTITKVGTTPPSEVIDDLSPIQREIFRARVPVNEEAFRQELSIKEQCDVQLYSRVLIPSSSTKSPADPDRLSDLERTLGLRATPQFDYTSQAVANWLVASKLQRAAKEGEVDFARRVFHVIATTFKYDYRGEQDRTAANVCSTGKSDCGGLSTLFVAALRSQGVPAHTLAGRWAKSAVPGEHMGEVAYFQEHVKAEFYAKGVGWVPADLSSAILHDTTPNKMRFFGNDPGDFITMHLDSELSFDTVFFGTKTLTLLQKASYWAIGSGNFEGVVVTENWTVH